MTKKDLEKWLLPGIIIGALIFFPSVVELIRFIAWGILNNEPIFDTYFLYLLIWTIIGGAIFYYSYSSYSQLNQRMKTERGLARRSEKQARELPKKYNYFCNSCLFQTNKPLKKCPKCTSGTLERVI